MEHLDDIINSVFFESLEFIVAPLILILLTHLILTDNETIKRFRYYAVEYNFVSLYSNLLFYFSLSAHRNEDPCITPYCMCNQVNNALLINCVFLSFLVLVHKQFKDNATIPKFLEYIFNKAWKAVMLILFLLIILINIHVHECAITKWADIINIFKAINKDDVLTVFLAIILYLLRLDHLLLLLFTFLIFGLLKRAWKSSQSEISLIGYQGPSIFVSNLAPEIRVKKQIKIAKNKESNPEIRMQAYYNAANYLYNLGEAEKSINRPYIYQLFFSHLVKYRRKNSTPKEIKKALIYIINAKNLGLTIFYPEGQLLPIRKLKMKINLALNQSDAADDEITEVQSKLASTDGLTKTILEYCVRELRKVLLQADKGSHNDTLPNGANATGTA